MGLLQQTLPLSEADRARIRELIPNWRGEVQAVRVRLALLAFAAALVVVAFVPGGLGDYWILRAALLVIGVSVACVSALWAVMAVLAWRAAAAERRSLEHDLRADSVVVTEVTTDMAMELPNDDEDRAPPVAFVLADGCVVVAGEWFEGSKPRTFPGAFTVRSLPSGRILSLDIPPDAPTIRLAVGARPEPPGSILTDRDLAIVRITDLTEDWRAFLRSE